MSTPVKKLGTKKTSSSESKKAIRMVKLDDVQDIYVDGMSGLMSGPTVTKLAFFVVVNSAKAEETRALKLRLILPTDVTLEMVSKLQEAFENNKQMMLDGVDDHKRKIATILAGKANR